MIEFAAFRSWIFSLKLMISIHSRSRDYFILWPQRGSHHPKILNKKLYFFDLMLRQNAPHFTELPLFFVVAWLQFALVRLYEPFFIIDPTVLPLPERCDPTGFQFFDIFDAGVITVGFDGLYPRPLWTRCLLPFLSVTTTPLCFAKGMFFRLSLDVIGRCTAWVLTTFWLKSFCVDIVNWYLVYQPVPELSWPKVVLCWKPSCKKTRSKEASERFLLRRLLKPAGK